MNPHISGLERAFDKNQKPKIIYWEVAISPKGQNNSISCFNNSISCLTKEPYYHNISGQRGAIDKIPKPKIIYWEVADSLEGQDNSISCLRQFHFLLC